MKKVLHITEAFGGGVQTALYSYLRSSQSEPIQHHLLARARGQDKLEHTATEQFASTHWVDGGLFDFWLAIKSELATLQPDVVHLHSSKAGVLGRLTKKRGKLVYTPHCYAFERQDVPDVANVIFKLLERWQLNQIDVVAGCSQRECDLALDLGAKRTLLLNNFADIPESATCNQAHLEPIEGNRRSATHYQLVVLGRVAPQKDPQFLLDTLKCLATLRPQQDYHVTWIGGGDKKLTAQLEQANVSVTGMVAKEQIWQRLRQSDLYLHTAAWEGMPLTILEAAGIKLPMVIREIGATADLDYPYLASTPQKMAVMISHCLDELESLPFADYCQTLNQKFSQKNQRLALLNLYDLAHENV